MRDSLQSKVSMVMPVYNSKDNISVMLESIINQTWDNVELIMVNDGSTDGTRVIIEEWIPKFRKRKYSVKIIDQENQGISAAVRNGMLRMTGDYFCSVDNDDYLYPEYVSTMASWLDKHPEYDYTACGFERVFGTKDNWIIKKADMEAIEPLSSPNLAENILLKRTEMVTWIYLIRKTYLDKCKIIENFVTEPRLHQEPSIALPLAMGGGQIKYFPQVLLRHFLIDRKSSFKETNRRFPDYVEKFTRIVRTVVKVFPTLDECRRNKLLNICEFFKIKLMYGVNEKVRECDEDKIAYARQLANLVNQYFEPSPGLTMEEILFSGVKPLFCMIENCILEALSTPIRSKIDVFNDARRVIGYGALGKSAKRLLPPLLKTNMKPDILWDSAAKPGNSLYEITVEKPDFSTLREDDVFILFPQDSSVAEQVMPYITNAGVKNCIRYFDLLQYLGECFYPCFCSNGCKLIFNK